MIYNCKITAISHERGLIIIEKGLIIVRLTTALFTIQ